MKLHKSLTTALKERSEVTALKLTLKGDVPPAIYDFPNLRELYLDGECENLGALTLPTVQILSLKCPTMKGDLSQLFSLPMLENLKIIETPMARFMLPLGFSSAPLKFLTIKDCGLRELPEEISMLGYLTEVNLSGNLLEKIPRSFSDLAKLKRLNLDGNQFHRFPDSIKNMRALTHLSIDRNPFPEEEIERVEREFHLTIH